MRFDFEVRTRRSDATRSFDSYTDGFMTGWSATFRPLDPFDTRDYDFVVSILVEIHNDVGRREQQIAEARRGNQ